MHIFTLARCGETQASTWGTLFDPAGTELCKILERGDGNLVHPRIPAGVYDLARKPFGSSRFDGAFKELIGRPLYQGVLWLPNVPSRSNIEIHTANLIQQLEGCLATGGSIEQDSHGDFCVTGGTSKPAYKRVYPIFSAAINVGGAQLAIKDIGQ